VYAGQQNHAPTAMSIASSTRPFVALSWTMRTGTSRRSTASAAATVGAPFMARRADHRLASWPPTHQRFHSLTATEQSGYLSCSPALARVWEAARKLHGFQWVRSLSAKAPVARDESRWSLVSPDRPWRNTSRLALSEDFLRAESFLPWLREIRSQRLTHPAFVRPQGIRHPYWWCHDPPDDPLTTCCPRPTTRRAHAASRV
jgi:hypothetical protein